MSRQPASISLRSLIAAISAVNVISAVAAFSAFAAIFALAIPTLAQTSFDPVTTFVPFGHKEETNDHLARTLKNEQELKFRTRVLGRRGVVLVEFSLPTCAACDPAAKSIIELLPKFGGKVDYVRLDLNKNLGLSYRYDVPEVPAVLVFKNGLLVDKFVTFKPEHKKPLTEIVFDLLQIPNTDDKNRTAPGLDTKPTELVLKNKLSY